MQFAYLVSHFLGRNQKELLGLLETFSQQQLLGGLAELFSEAVVSQPDKSIVSWRSFSQALVSSTLAAGRPPRIATDARVTLARVAIHQGSNAGGSRGGSSGAGDGGSSQGSVASLTISEEHAVFHLPPPLDRLLVCERMDSKAKAGGGGGGGGGSSSSGPTRYRISLWQHLTTKTTRGDSSTEGSRKGGAATGFVFGAAPYGDSRVECANVLLEHGPMVDCTCLVPTLPASSRSGAGGRELSVAALSTGLSIVSGSSSQRALSVWVLSTPPGGGNRYRLDETLSMGTPRPSHRLVTHGVPQASPSSLEVPPLVRSSAGTPHRGPSCGRTARTPTRCPVFSRSPAWTSSQPPTRTVPCVCGRHTFQGCRPTSRSDSTNTRNCSVVDTVGLAAPPLPLLPMHQAPPRFVAWPGCRLSKIDSIYWSPPEGAWSYGTLPSASVSTRSPTMTL